MLQPQSFDWNHHRRQWRRLHDVCSHDNPSLCEDNYQSVSRSPCSVRCQARFVLVLARTCCEANARCVCSMHSHTSALYYIKHMLVERLSQTIFCECTFARLSLCSDDFLLALLTTSFNTGKIQI